MRASLEKAGFKDIRISAHDQAVTSGDLDAMTTVLLKVGPLGRIVRENPELRLSAETRVRAALATKRSDPRRLAGSDLGCERTSLIDLERPPNIGDGVDLSRPIVITRTTEIGATLPLTVVAAKDDCPPGGAIRGPSSSSTALDPERTAQTDPKRTGGVSTQASGRGFHLLKNALAFLQTIFSTFDWFMPPSKADLGNTKHGTSSPMLALRARPRAILVMLGARIESRWGGQLMKAY